MNKKELNDALLKKFNLICFIDLADLRSQHRTVFDIFKKYRKDQFSPDDRLVFYSSYKPDQDFLNHIQNAASRIDISNFFILIVCPFDITKELELANKKIGYDHVVIKSIVENLIDTEPFLESKFSKYDSLCPFPFTQIDVEVDGNIKPCCKFKEVIGNIHDSTVLDVFANDKIQKIRNQMIAGEKPASCRVCWENESTGTTSHRMHALAKHRDQLNEGWLDDPQVRIVNLAPSSLCNFACRICRPRLSTKLAVEELKFETDTTKQKKLKQFINLGLNSTAGSKIVESFNDLTEIENLHILGGEPFLWPQLKDLIDFLIDRGLSKKIRLELNTNGSQYPSDLVNLIIENFKFVEFLISIDNVKDRFELERGGKWEDVYQNIKKFSSLRSQNIIVKLAPAINIQNLLYLNDIIELNNELSLDEIVWNYLESPKYLCIDNVTKNIKQLVHEKYRDHPTQELRSIAHRVLLSEPTNSYEFIKFMDQLDSRRGQNWRTTHRELAQALDK